MPVYLFPGIFRKDFVSLLMGNSVRIAALERLNRHEEADAEMRHMLEIAETERGIDHTVLAKMYRGTKHWEAAAEVLARILAE